METNPGLKLGRTAYEFAQAAVWGVDPRTGLPAREIACFGARGDGKTFTALSIMIEHSRRHSNAGYKLPVRWIGVRDTFASHKENTVSTLLNPPDVP